LFISPGAVFKTAEAMFFLPDFYGYF